MTHDYAKGTRARRWLQNIFGPILRVLVRALLWLCPDTPIVANVRLHHKGAAFFIESEAVGGMIINVRIQGAPKHACIFEATP